MFSLAAGLLTLQLPETVNVPLLTTPLEAEDFFKAHRYGFIILIEHRERNEIFFTKCVIRNNGVSFRIEHGEASETML